MFQSCEDLSLAKETRNDLLGIHSALDELERHTLLELAIGSRRQPHYAHPSAANRFQKSISTDKQSRFVARLSCRGGRDEGRGERLRGCGEETRRGGVGGKQ
jgi:hypothetical protein